MASFAVIVKPPGGADGKNAAEPGGNTGPMAQAQAMSYLTNVLGADPGSKLTNLGQCLNNVFGDEGKSNGDLKFNGFATRHASHGVVGVSCVSLFFYINGSTAYIFAMGEHKGSDSYKISYFGPTTGTFRKNATVQL
jgi:hypothetical protein